MKRLTLTFLFFLMLLLNSCQCSWRPDVGPVEGEDDSEEAVVKITDKARV